MTDAIEARRELVRSARLRARLGMEFHTWRDTIAPQWALDALSQREIDAIAHYIFGVPHD